MTRKLLHSLVLEGPRTPHVLPSKRSLENDLVTPAVFIYGRRRPVQIKVKVFLLTRRGENV